MYIFIDIPIYYKAVTDGPFHSVSDLERCARLTLAQLTPQGLSRSQGLPLYN